VEVGDRPVRVYDNPYDNLLERPLAPASDGSPNLRVNQRQLTVAGGRACAPEQEAALERLLQTENPEHRVSTHVLQRHVNQVTGRVHRDRVSVRGRVPWQRHQRIATDVKR
jgi:hypothetical protein